MNPYQYAQAISGTSYPTSASSFVSNVTKNTSSDGEENSGDGTGDATAKAAMLSALGAQRTWQLGLQALNNSMKMRKNALKSNYDSSLESLKSDYDFSSGNINSNAENSLKQAYVNNMMSQKNLKQKLASQGLTGGATESTLARLLNAYGNNRNNIDTQRNKDLSSLENVYTSNRSKALQDYNNALANLEIENYNAQNTLANTFYDRINQAIYDYANSGNASDDTLNSALGYYAGQFGLR